MLTNIQGRKSIAIFVCAYQGSSFEITKDFKRVIYVIWVSNMVYLQSPLVKRRISLTPLLQLPYLALLILGPFLVLYYTYCKKYQLMIEVLN